MTTESPFLNQLYHLKSDKGYWLPGGYGYTHDIKKAGRFSLADIWDFNLDGVTLIAVSDL